MIPKVRFGRTGVEITRIVLGGFPFGGINRARGWDPFIPAGRATAIETIHAALDAGHLATKVGYRGLSPGDVTASVEASLRRLRTDEVDVIQFHGGMYEASDVDHILNDGLLDALESLRTRGLTRFIGFTTEEPWTARPLIATGRFDVVQLRYNLIYQSAALHALNEARAADMGVAVMRPMTSGILQRLATHIAPEWQRAHDLTRSPSSSSSPTAASTSPTSACGGLTRWLPTCPSLSRSSRPSTWLTCCV